MAYISLLPSSGTAHSLKKIEASCHVGFISLRFSSQGKIDHIQYVSLDYD